MPPSIVDRIAGLARALTRHERARAFGDAVSAGRIEPLAGLAEAHPDDRPAFLDQAVTALEHEDDDAGALALLRAGLVHAAGDPHLSRRLARALARRPEERAAAEAVYREILARRADVDVACELAGLLVDLDRPADARAVLADQPATAAVRVALGKAWLAEGDLDCAAALLGSARESLLADAAKPEGAGARELLAEASSLLTEAQSARHGRESAVAASLVESARARIASGDAGVNYRLLGAALMVDAKRRPTVLRLAPADADARAARERLARDPADPDALTRLGCAELRRGEVGEALAHFDRACAADRDGFAAYLGYGAALDARAERTHARARALPDLPVPAGLDAVVPDLPALTDLERRVVVAIAHPLRATLPALAARGAHVRILPLDVRPVDLPELADRAGRRTDDHRTLDALGGLAHAGALAIARVETLLELDTPHGSTLAHELAHLVHHHLLPRAHARIEALHAASLGAEHVFQAYALKNPHEFFACAYTDFVRRRYGLRLRVEGDDGGHLARVLAIFAGIEAAAAERVAGVRCPACGWTPRATSRWVCTCGHRWNTFDTQARCPACGKQHEETACPGCRASSPHAHWYAPPTP